MDYQKALDFQGKVALIYGGNDIAQALAYCFASYGANIILAAENADASLIANLPQVAGGHLTYALKPNQNCGFADLLSFIKEQYGHLDFLIIDNYGNASRQIADFSPEIWDQTFDRRIKRSFFLAQAAAELMREQQFGRIVFITNHATYKYRKGQLEAAVSANAIHAMLKTMALEWAEDNIYVNGVAPAWIEAGEMAQLMAEKPDKKALMEQQIALGRVGVPEDIVGLPLFLCSPLAGFVVGQVISVNGGYAL